MDHCWNWVETGRPDGFFVGRPCPQRVLFGHDDDVNRLTTPSRQRSRLFPEKERRDGNVSASTLSSRQNNLSAGIRHPIPVLSADLLFLP